jgi:hypothetical protein
VRRSRVAPQSWQNTSKPDRRVTNRGTKRPSSHTAWTQLRQKVRRVSRPQADHVPDYLKQLRAKGRRRLRPLSEQVPTRRSRSSAAGCAKTRSDLVILPCGTEFYRFFALRLTTVVLASYGTSCPSEYQSWLAPDRRSCGWLRTGDHDEQSRPFQTLTRLPRASRSPPHQRREQFRQFKTRAI